MEVYVLALLAALAFALGSVLQQRGTLQTEAAEGDPRFLKEIIRKPVWLAGGLLQASGWGLQAPAMAASNATTRVVSVLLGVAVFGETLASGQERLLPALVGLALAVVGVIVLARPEDR